MQLYAQWTIQGHCEETTSERVLRTHNRMETESLKKKIIQLVDLLIAYAEKRPESFNLENAKAEAESFWEARISEVRAKKMGVNAVGLALLKS